MSNLMSLLAEFWCVFCGSHTHTHTQVSKPVLDNVLNCLRIEVSDITITLSARWASHNQNVGMSDYSFTPVWLKTASQKKRISYEFVCPFSSVGEREDWFHTLSRAIADHAAGLCTFGGPCREVKKKKKSTYVFSQSYIFLSNLDIIVTLSWVLSAGPWKVVDGPGWGCSCTGPSFSCDDVHELYFWLQPHTQTTPLQRVWQGQLHRPANTTFPLSLPHCWLSVSDAKLWITDIMNVINSRKLWYS